MAFLTLAFNPDDIIPVLRSMQNELIILGVALVLAIVAALVVGKKPKATKKFVRGTSLVAFLMALIIVVNLIITGPMFSIVNMALNPEVSGNISEESIEEASELCTDIAEEGMILLKNEGSLPLAKGTKLNTFGWSSTSARSSSACSSSRSRRAISERFSLREGFSAFSRGITA